MTANETLIKILRLAETYSQNSNGPRRSESFASLSVAVSCVVADKARIDWLEKHGVQSIYFRDGKQMNPASLSLRAAIDLSPDL